MNVLVEMESIKDEIIAWRRELHKIPETGLVLPQTAEFVKSKLTEMGIEYVTFENHSGIVAVIGKKSGKTVAIRADMDGLLVKEETELEYASQNDNMHACGHDAHTASLLGVAKVLNKHEDELNGQIKLLFQPAEEGPGGAFPMIEDGVLENPKVDYILAMHVGDLGAAFENSKLGDIVVNEKNMFASDEQINLVIKGKGGHGSAPDMTVDPIAISATIINSIQHIVSREVKPGKPTVITFSSIEGGRGAYNIIPDSIELRGTIRNIDLESRDFVFERIRGIVDGIVKGMRGEYELNFMDGYAPLINDKNVVESFVKSAKKLINKEEIHYMTGPMMGGEDAAFFFLKVPGCYFFLNTPSTNKDGKFYPPHNSKFCIDDSVLYKGAALLTQGAIDLLD